MDKRTETLEQLRHAERLLYQKVDAVSALSSTETQIKRLQSESEKGVPYQLWYPTNHAEIEKMKIEEELQNTRNAKLLSLKLRTILGSAIPGGIAVIGFLSTVGKWDAIVPIMFLLIPIFTFPTLVVTAIVQRKRLSRAPLEWEQQHYLNYEAAQQQDAKNTQLNYQKKAILDKELRKQNAVRIAELQSQLPEQQRTYDRCCAEVDKLDILGRKDRNLYTVGQLIHIIESNRADNITSALLVYDEQQARKEAQRAQEEAVATTRKMAQQMAEAEELRREEQLLRDQAEREHRRRMEELAYMQLSEMEKQRGEMEQQRKQVERDAAADAAYRRRMEELAKEQNEELERQRKDDYDYRKYGRINNP